jgi:D-alanyl-D-alanine carboxypeptidase/D-alanyl-D-alanine-endopeptidase (penicillin-binding protein 4)
MIQKRFRFLIAIALLAAACRGRAELAEEIKNVLADGLLSHAQVSIDVVRLGDEPQHCTVVYQYHSELPLAPASNLKLATTSAALDTFGPDFHYRTRLLMHGRDLVLIGDGDPTLGDGELLHKAGWEITTLFHNWAEALVKKGVTHVDNVLVDDSIFDTEFLHPHWDVRQRDQSFSAEVGGVNFNANCVNFFFEVHGDAEATTYRADPPTSYLQVDNTVLGGAPNAIAIRRGANLNALTFTGTCPQSSGVPISVPVDDPPMYAATVLADVFKQSGVQVSGKVSRDRSVRAMLDHPAATTNSTQPSEKWTLLAVYETPLSQVLARANKDSMNLYAEALCKRLGFAASGQSGSWDNGTAAVGAFLLMAGVPASEFHLDDGCGLSHQNRISTNALVHVLIYNYCGKNREPFMASLSISGTDGTLEKRFPGAFADLRGRVIGKSGFIEGVSAISGYLHAKDEHWYAFSIIMNGIPHLSNSAIKPLQEAIIRAVDRSASPAN